MFSEVVLKVARGWFEGKEYAFRDHTVCTIGRSSDCVVQLPNNPGHLDVSRHHCAIVVDPPFVRVRDLGSKNGTYVNGEIVGKRAQSSPAGDDTELTIPERILDDGDEIRVGGTLFRVRIAERDLPVADGSQAHATVG